MTLAQLVDSKDHEGSAHATSRGGNMSRRISSYEHDNARHFFECFMYKTRQFATYLRIRKKGKITVGIFLARVGRRGCLFREAVMATSAVSRHIASTRSYTCTQPARPLSSPGARILSSKPMSCCLCLPPRTDSVRLMSTHDLSLVTGTAGYSRQLHVQLLDRSYSLRTTS